MPLAQSVLQRKAASQGAKYRVSGTGPRLAKKGEAVALRARLWKVWLPAPGATGKVVFIHSLTIACPSTPKCTGRGLWEWQVQLVIWAYSAHEVCVSLRPHELSTYFNRPAKDDCGDRLACAAIQAHTLGVALAGQYVNCIPVTSSAPFISFLMTARKRLPSPRWLSARARSLSPKRSGRSKILPSSPAVSACLLLTASCGSDAASLTAPRASLTLCSPAPTSRGALGMLSLDQPCFSTSTPAYVTYFVSVIS